MIKQVLTVLAAFMGIVLIVAALQGRPSLTAPATASEPPEVAAQKDLPQLIEIIQVAAHDFGFTDEQEVTDITLGHPYQMYNIHYDHVKNYTTDMSAEQVLIPEQRWDFPVLLDGQAKGMARLGLEDGMLQFIGFAATPQLAQNLVDFQAKHDQTEEGDPITLLLISPLHTTFAVTQHNEQTQLTLILDVEPSQQWYFTDLDESQPYDLEEVIPQIGQELTELEQKYDN